MAILGIHVSFRGWRVHAVISSTEIFLFPQSSWSCKQRFRPWIYQQKFRPERTNLSWKQPRYVCVYIYRDMSYMYNMFNNIIAYIYICIYCISCFYISIHRPLKIHHLQPEIFCVLFGRARCIEFPRMTMRRKSRVAVMGLGGSDKFQNRWFADTKS